MKAIIMAGGKGTRIASLKADVPKPMIEIEGKPILQYQIECLQRQDIRDIILIIGYLGDKVEGYFHNGSRFGVNISYIREEMPLGTAGALYYLKGVIKEDFLLMNGDSILDVDMKKFQEAHLKNNGLVTILTHPNSHPYDSGVILADRRGIVKKWLTKEEERCWYKNRVNAGLHMISPKLLERFDSVQKRDLDRDILKPLIAEEQLYVYDSPEYIKDMGTPDRYYSVVEDIRSGLVKQRNLSYEQRAVFLDRDGTINKYVGFLNDIDAFELIEGVSKAIKLLNNSGYLVIVVTNQPVIARGEITLEELEEIHNKMETLLGTDGAYVDDIFYCPHHPDKGFEGERPEYKIQCCCRKPEIGMLLQAAEKYNINLTRSWMIGDGTVDVETGKKAGCKVAYLGNERLQGIPTYENLLECVTDILNLEKSEDKK